jgi:hypothetical protein
LLVRNGGNVTEAVAFARRAVDAEPHRVRYHLALADLLLLAGEPSQAEAETQQALGSELSSVEEDANALLALAHACKPGVRRKALGTRESPSGSETPAESFAHGTSLDADAPRLRARAVVHSIACTADGRILTLPFQEKDMTFQMSKTTRLSLPETFWLALEYLDASRHFAGEPAMVKYKSRQPDSEPVEVTSFEIEDRY